MKIKFRCFSPIRVVVTFLLMVAFFSCTDQGLTEDEPQASIGSESVSTAVVATDPLSNLATIRTLYSNIYSSNFSRASSYIVADGDYMYVNYERLIRDEATKMKVSFNVAQLAPRTFARQFQFSNNTRYNVLPSQITGATAKFSAGVLQILDNHATLMYGATDAASAIANYNTTKAYILGVTGGLTQNDKIFLLSAIESINEYSKRYFNGGAEAIYNAIASQRGAARVSSGCSVDWRGVFAGAVVGGVSGAITGATVGATGGTVALPGFGTVTGAVGGGVFGFAAGFVGGAVTSVATNLLTTCFRHDFLPAQPVDFQGTLCPSALGCPYEIADYKLWYYGAS